MKNTKEQVLPVKVINMWNTGIKVRDKRKENRYYIDNEFLNGYARRVGVYAQSVYMALCRHSRNGASFPGQDHLAEELGISPSSVKDGITKLKKYNIIDVEMRLDTKQGRGSNIYYLLDRTEWKSVTKYFNQKK